MNLRYIALRSCVLTITAAALCTSSAALSGCGAPAEEALGATAQGIDVRISAGSSLASAINRAAPGDRILVPAGTYAGGGWIERSGTATAPITIVAVDGPRTAVIEGGSESLRVGNSSYLVFDGFEVRNSGNNTVHIDNSHHITLRNVYAHDAGLDGDVLKVNQSHHMVIELSEFARPGRRTIVENPYQECLDFVDVDDSAIRDNFIHDGGSMLAFVKGGSRNTVIERNVFSQQRAGASDPMVGLGGPTDIELLQGEQYEIINVIFRNNVVMNGLVGAVAVYDAQGAYIANNLLLNNDRALVEFRAGNGPAGGTTNVQVVNNLMVDTRGRMPTPYLLSSHTLSGLATSYNTYWNNGAALPTTSLLSLSSQVGHLATNPLVAVPAATATRAAVLSTVRPASGSPALGTAMVASASPFGVIDDVMKVARGTTRDRGPFVLDTSTGTTTTSSTTTATTTTATTTTSTGSVVTSVSLSAGAAGVVGRVTTLTATSAGSSAPRYKFWVRNPSGVLSEPCGTAYGTSATCSFTPDVAGTWLIRVDARDVNSTATYQATTGPLSYAVAAASTVATNVCPEAVRISAAGNPIGVVSGHIRYCWPGMANCYCDADNDCYAQSGYVACTPP